MNFPAGREDLLVLGTWFVPGDHCYAVVCPKVIWDVAWALSNIWYCLVELLEFSGATRYSGAALNLC